MKTIKNYLRDYVKRECLMCNGNGCIECNYDGWIYQKIKVSKKSKEKKNNENNINN